jgi:hypothetical protein
VETFRSVGYLGEFSLSISNAEEASKEETDDEDYAIGGCEHDFMRPQTVLGQDGVHLLGNYWGLFHFLVPQTLIFLDEIVM